MAEFVAHRMLAVEVPLFVHGQSIALHADLRKLCDLCGKPLRLVAASTVWHHAIGETEGISLGRADSATGQDHVHRPRLSDEARQPHRATVDQRDAPAATEDAEDRALF